MGYNSDFEITTYPKIANKTLVKDYKYYLDNLGRFSNYCKWYDYKDDLSSFSSANENVIVSCFRIGEESGDIELLRWLNGNLIEEKKFDKKEFCKISDELKKRVDIFDCGSQENLEVKLPVVLVSCK